MSDRIRRRDLEKIGVAAGAALLGGCPSPERKGPAYACAPLQGGDVDYVVVGSGAGGGPLAANLARAGHQVVLLEAGGDPTSWSRDVPALHSVAAEDPDLRWNFFVRTYADLAQQQRNARFLPREGGVLYPRAGTLGGCTAHNALITLCPHNADWDGIAATFGDPSWSADSMSRYFERLERCAYAPHRARNLSRHGFDGWLPTATADPLLAFGDPQLRAVVEAAIGEAGRVNPHQIGDALRMILRDDQALWDPNDWRMISAMQEGMVFVPLHVDRGARSGPREYVRAVAAACPSHLRVELDALCTRVILDDHRRAVGVEYLKGASLYRASAHPSPDPGEPRTLRVRREVILAGGVFNSPQILMLSGVGPRAHLADHGIEARVDLPGVGKNLQDRYEIGVVSEMAADFEVLRGATVGPPDPERPDPALRRWWFDRTGPYTTSGVVGAIVKRSRPDLPVPDLFLFGLVGNFRGYYPGYSRDLEADHRHFTWGVLKAHTRNTAGEVRLRSADPRDRPDIDFRSFTQGGDLDVEAVVEGVISARRVMASLGDRVKCEVAPGPEVRTRAEIAAYVRDQAWGHHASCSNKMGPRSDPMAVVDQRFRVHGTTGLRVVDASVFPKIPGFFIVTPVFMIAEKATDVILEDAGG